MMSSSGFKRKRPRSGGGGGNKSNTSLASEQQNKASQWSANIPISLGKPSLRRRLEDYYSLISPDVIQNENGEEWKKKFELIYDKYGGSVQGEFKLAQKLAKKYGGNVIRLKLTTSAGNVSGNANSNANPNANEKNQKISSHPESWYEFDSKTKNNSGILDFTSENFDPIATLSKSTPVSKVYDANPNPFAVKDDKGVPIPVPFLDNISKFQGYLPTCDPLYKAPILRIRKRNANEDATSTSTSTSAMKKKIPVFTAMAAQYEHADAGPLSMLHSIHVQRQRVRVLVRYVDCIRGTLTGYLVAFDKHFNMILRDVDEVYTSRITKVLSSSSSSSSVHQNKNTKADDDDINGRNINGHAWTKGELEERRRRCVEKTSHSRGRSGGGRLYPHHHQQSGILSKTAVEDDCDGGRNDDDDDDAELGLDRLVRVGQRHMHQMLVRGDNVVSVWRANGEQQRHHRHGHDRSH